jgi:hypothetical protein
MFKHPLQPQAKLSSPKKPPRQLPDCVDPLAKYRLPPSHPVTSSRTTTIPDLHSTSHLPSVEVGDIVQLQGKVILWKVSSKEPSTKRIMIDNIGELYVHIHRVPGNDVLAKCVASRRMTKLNTGSPFSNSTEFLTITTHWVPSVSLHPHLSLSLPRPLVDHANLILHIHHHHWHRPHLRPVPSPITSHIASPATESSSIRSLSSAILTAYIRET